jgi:putative restriction endonuclease
MVTAALSLERREAMKGTKQFILTQIRNLNVWRRGAERAPHKPLLMLLALGQLARGNDRLWLFSDLEEPLSRLLKDFGPPRRSAHPEYPFWRLQADKLWEVSNADALTRRRGNTDPLKTELRKKQVRGGFPKQIHNALSSDATFFARVAEILLEGHFPASLHMDILDAIGLHLPLGSKERRNTQFRFDVFQAYENRCAICGYDLRLGSVPLALEVVHIRWPQAGGPDEIQNALALCSIHQKALNRGAIGLSYELTLLVSSELNGQGWVEEWFDSFKGRRIRQPIRPDLNPKPEYIRWHTEEVFRKPAQDQNR